MKINRSVSALLAGTAALSLVLAGCSSTDKGTTAASESASTSASASKSESADSKTVTLTNAYIKEKPADKKMTGIFGVLKNPTDKNINITSFTVEGLKEGTVFEQHDTKDGKMFKIDAGHVIPAGGELKLAPGDKHLMIMKNGDALQSGQEYKLVLELSDGSKITQSIPVRVQAAGEEDYGSDGTLNNPNHKGGAPEDKMKGHDHDHDHDHDHSGGEHH